MNKNYTFTSESVSEGHPDKVCDITSDTILDLYLSEFNESRVACETLATTNKIIISGEIRGPKIDPQVIEQAVREQIKNIGYENLFLCVRKKKRFWVFYAKHFQESAMWSRPARRSRWRAGELQGHL